MDGGGNQPPDGPPGGPPVRPPVALWVALAEAGIIGLDVLGAALALAFHANTDGTVSMTTATAANMWRMSDRSAARMLAELQRSGIIRKISAGNAAGAYVFVPELKGAAPLHPPTNVREYMLCQDWHNVRDNVNSVMTGLTDDAKSGITQTRIDEDRGRGRAGAVVALRQKTKGSNNTPGGGAAPVVVVASETAPLKPDTAPSDELRAARAYLRGLGVTAAAIDRAERAHGPEALQANAAALKSKKTVPSAGLAAAAIRDNYAGPEAAAKNEAAAALKNAAARKREAEAAAALEAKRAEQAAAASDAARAARVAALPVETLAAFIERIKSGEAGAFMARNVRAKSNRSPADIAQAPGVSAWIAEQLELNDV